MAPIRFTTLLLGILLLIVTVRDSISHTHKVVNEAATVANGYWFVATSGDSASVNKDLSGDVDVSATRNKWLKGRKMMVENVLGKEMKEKMVNDPSKISGKGKNASNKPFGQSQTGMKDKQGDKMLKPKTLNGGKRKITDLPNSQQLNYQVSEATSTNGSLEFSSRSKASIPLGSRDLSKAVESLKLLQVAIENMNMVSMDYGYKPHPSPPINNAQPLNEENVGP
ncbi:uncharacterized protein LOC143856629 [Tasmannia lanceolata]|uniref:uncharacterized protein LOC143856629 n=1 Tax=Tasmannia lanceolata TaxID=3420 RepID=UPI004062EEF6